MNKKNKICQSCAMPMNKDKGTNELSKYCSLCYDNGKFVHPDITLNEMKELVIDKMVEMKMPRWMGKLYVKKIDKLDRWKNK